MPKDKFRITLDPDTAANDNGAVSQRKIPADPRLLTLSRIIALGAAKEFLDKPANDNAMMSKTNIAEDKDINTDNTSR